MAEYGGSDTKYQNKVKIADRETGGGGILGPIPVIKYIDVYTITDSEKKTIKFYKADGNTHLGTMDLTTNRVTMTSNADSDERKYFSTNEGRKLIKNNATNAYNQDVYNAEIAAGKSPNSAIATTKKGQVDLFNTNENGTPNISINTNPERDTNNERKSPVFTLKGVTEVRKGTLWGEKAFSAKSKTLVYPEDHSSEEYDFIKITPIEYVPALGDLAGMGSRTRTNSAAVNPGARLSMNLESSDWFGFKGVESRYLRVKRVGSTMFLPMTSDIGETNGVDWGGSTMTPLQAAAGRVAFDAIGRIGQAQGFSGLGAALSGTVQDTAAATNAFIQNPQIKDFIKAYFAGQAAGGVNLLGRAGLAINPNLEVLFNGPQLRTFAYNFRFTPRTESEATTIRTIIKVLKKTMAPKRRDKVFLSVPAVYKIQYIFNSDLKDHPFLNKLKPCALTSFNVQYAPDGNYMTYDDGSMTSYNVSMKFDELEPIYNDDIDDVDSPTTGF